MDTNKKLLLILLYVCILIPFVTRASDFTIGEMYYSPTPGGELSGDYGKRIDEPESRHEKVVVNATAPVFGKASHYNYDYPKGSKNWVTKKKLVTAARDWPRGTILKITNTSNGKSVIVKVTDSGPDKKKYPERVVDLGSLAFSKIAKLSEGVIDVKVEVVK